MNTHLATLGVGTVLAMVILMTIEYFVPQLKELFHQEIADGVSIKVALVYLASNVWAYFRPPVE